MRYYFPMPTPSALRLVPQCLVIRRVGRGFEGYEQRTEIPIEYFQYGTDFIFYYNEEIGLDKDSQDYYDCYVLFQNSTKTRQEKIEVKPVKFVERNTSEKGIFVGWDKFGSGCFDGGEG